MGPDSSHPRPHPATGSGQWASAQQHLHWALPALPCPFIAGSRAVPVDLCPSEEPMGTSLQPGLLSQFSVPYP